MMNDYPEIVKQLRKEEQNGVLTCKEDSSSDKNDESTIVFKEDYVEKKTEIGTNAQINNLLSIFNELDEIIYISDPKTYEMLYMNAPAKNYWGDWKGKKCYKFLQNRDSPCPFC